MGREEEGFTHTLPLCDHSGRAMLGRRAGVTRKPVAGCWEETCYSSCQGDTLLPLSPQHSWLLVTLTPSLPQVKKRFLKQLQPIYCPDRILLFPFLPSASEELPSSPGLSPASTPMCGCPKSQDQDLPNPGRP